MLQDVGDVVGLEEVLGLSAQREMAEGLDSRKVVHVAEGLQKIGGKHTDWHFWPEDLVMHQF